LRDYDVAETGRRGFLNESRDPRDDFDGAASRRVDGVIGL